MKHPRNGHRGFTLVELLIVVAIIGIIAAIAIPNLIVAMGRAEQRATMAEMRSYATFLNLYLNDTAQLPDCHEDFPCVFNRLNPYYSTNLKLYDAWGSMYIYRMYALPDKTRYELRSMGKDGIEGALFRTVSPMSAVELDLLIRDGTFIMD